MLICIILPEFVVGLEGTHPDVPTVVYDTRVRPHTIYALCGAARRIGITKAMNKATARALCPDAHEVVIQPKRYTRVAHERAVALLNLTDRIEIEQSDSLTIWLDVGKASPAEMNTIISQLQAEFAAEPFRIGIASGFSFSRIIAWTAPRGTIRTVVPGQEKAILAPMPIDQFATPDSFKEDCQLLGIRTLADLGRLSYNDVVKRFKAIGGQLHKLYHGEDRQTLTPFAAPLREEIRLTLDNPVDDRAIAERVLNHLSEHLAKRLVERSLACSEITLTIELENHTALEATQTLRQATQSQKLLAAELVRLLGKAKITTGMAGFHVLCDNLKPPVPQQLDFFSLLFPTPEQIAESLAPRHPTTPAYRITVTQERSYLPENNVVLESLVAT